MRVESEKMEISSPRKSWRRSFKVQHDSSFNRSSHFGICENVGVFDNRHLRPSRVGRASVSFNHHQSAMLGLLLVASPVAWFLV